MDRQGDMLATQIEQLQNELDCQINRSTHLAQKIEAREAVLRALFASRSWRLTAPLRALANFFRESPPPITPSAAVHPSPTAAPAPRDHRRLSPARPTIFVECTHTAQTELNTGIQRVVRNILLHAGAVAKAPGFEVVPVILDNDQLVPVDLSRVVKQKLDADRPEAIDLDRYTDFSGCLLLLLDSSWHIPVWPAVQRFRERGGRIMSVIYDLIPITHAWTSVPELTASFTAWLRENVQASDGFCCISNAVAQQLRDFIAADPLVAHRLEDLPIGHFHLGAELDLIHANARVRASFQAMFDTTEPTFIMVGSIEPRKNHAFALDAFDLRWDSGKDGVLIIIGRGAWKMAAFLTRVKAHREYGRRLFLVRDAEDAELEFAYRHAAALLIPSVIEGFGLPVVEAFQRGLPVLASDIPVFQEIAAGQARFFAIDSPANLAQALEAFSRERAKASAPLRETHAWIDWRQSTEQLLTNVFALMKA